MRLLLESTDHQAIIERPLATEVAAFNRLAPEQAVQAPGGG
jgi:hypothetical protein